MNMTVMKVKAATLQEENGGSIVLLFNLEIIYCPFNFPGSILVVKQDPTVAFNEMDTDIQFHNYQ